LKLGLDNKKGVMMGQGRNKRKQVLERGWRRKRAGEWMDQGRSRRKEVLEAVVGAGKWGWRSSGVPGTAQEAFAMLRFDWETTGGEDDVGKGAKVEGSNCLRQVAVEAGAGQQEGCEDGSGSEQKEAGA
jgi:hypothetical protein